MSSSGWCLSAKPVLHETMTRSFLTENQFVEWLRLKALKTGHGVKVGIGDDAAVLSFRQGHDVLLKSDMTIEGVHFSADLHPPRAVGHRALARSLSDIAAMGGTPKFALVSLAMSRDATRAWVGSFYAGLLALARRFAVTVVGGDTAVVPEATMVDLIVAGQVKQGRALLRSGARPGDVICVSGCPGSSALGLQILSGREISRGKPPARVSSRDGLQVRAIRAHLYPEPRLALGRYLLDRRLASAAMDISDGIAIDLGRLSEASGVGAIIWQDHLPKPTAAELRNMDWLSLALRGGEDYELLFTVPRHKVPMVATTFQGTPVTHIGEITKSKGLRVVRLNGREQELEPAGYDHFRKKVESQTSKSEK